MPNDMKFCRFLYKGGLLILFLFLQVTTLFAQNWQDTGKRITLHVKDKLINVFEKMTLRDTLYFTYSKKDLEDEKIVTIDVTNEPVAAVMEKLLADKELKCTINGHFITITRNKTDSLIRITGRVTDKYGILLPAASVAEVENVNGVVTGPNGKFSIFVSAKASKLEVRYVGYNDETVNITGKNSIHVIMTPKEKSLEGMNVIGYVTAEKRALTGNIDHISEKVFAEQPVLNPLLAMEGRTPGLTVTPNTGIAGGGMNVQIRGRNSIRNTSTENSPYYIVDGVPYPSGPLNIKGISLYPAAGNVPYNGISQLNYINPADMASISVLKDADATAIYGSRGANGVILITTKRGKKGDMRVHFTSYLGVGKVAHQVKLFNTQQYLQMRREAMKNDDTTISLFDYDVNGAWDTTRQTNWQKELIGKTAVINDQYIMVSGGNSRVQYLFSGGRHHETMVFPGDNSLLRYTAHFSLNTVSLNQRFRSSFVVDYAYGHTDLIGEDLTKTALILAPDAPPVYADSGKLNWQNNTYSNPLLSTKRPYRNNVYNSLYNLQFSYDSIILKGLSFKNNLGLLKNSLAENSRRYRSSFNPAVAPVIPLYTVFGYSRIRTWIEEPQLNYQQSIGKGKLNLLVGGTYQNEIIDQRKHTASGFPSEEQMEDITTANQSTITSDQTYSEYRYGALFGRIGFDWNYKYMISLSGRRDASSRFGPGNQVAGFLAVGGAWIFSQENGIKDKLPFLSYGKLRASYGTTGSDQIPNYEYLDAYTATSTGQYQGVQGIIPSRPSNPNFKWEENKKLEVALEMEFMNNVISTTIACFRNRSSNQLIGYQLPPTAGFPTVQFNLDAVIQNKGLEVEITSNNIRSKSFIWKSAFNLTVPQNKLVSFPRIGNSSYANQFVVGQPLTIVKLYHNEGVAPATGIYQIENVYKDDSYDVKDQQTIRSTDPVFYGGLENSIRYKSLEITLFFQFVKQSGYNYLYYTGLPGQFNQNQPVEVLNRWRSPGDDKPVQQYSTSTDKPAGQVYNSYINSNSLITDASYIRLKSFSISYDLPERWLNKKIISANVFFNGENVLTFTKYKGLDPENQHLGLPPLRVLTTGFRMTF